MFAAAARGGTVARRAAQVRLRRAVCAPPYRQSRAAAGVARGSPPPPAPAVPRRPLGRPQCAADRRAEPAYERATGELLAAFFPGEQFGAERFWQVMCAAFARNDMGMLIECWRYDFYSPAEGTAGGGAAATPKVPPPALSSYEGWAEHVMQEMGVGMNHLRDAVAAGLPDLDSPAPLSPGAARPTKRGLPGLPRLMPPPPRVPRAAEGSEAETKARKRTPLSDAPPPL
eukprot:TRINITY_DN36686_c0_g1_i1.p2 TRINITY_DN36686_c0_g1~~TRINITY_DN36686_c0_g1_i1.p2  ORF type:complete len:257 (+),score=52.60 TRINITY_DN36686_c0_g1_i1:87-773(+)